jgi:enoyl-CoA hydratase
MARGADNLPGGGMRSGADGRIHAGREGGLARIVIDNPAKRNALDLAMWEFAERALAELAEDPAVRLLEVSGTGGTSFAAGADISRFAEERATPAAVAHYAAITSSVYRRLAEFPRPTLARICGACMGGGLALAACCDLRIATQGSEFAIPAARLGLAYGVEAQARLSGLIGASATAELLITARRIDAPEALRLGFLHHVRPADTFSAFADAYADQVVANAPLTLATVKAVRVALAAGELAQRRDALEGMVSACFASRDYAEGRAAFAERRKPGFEGN